MEETIDQNISNLVKLIEAKYLSTETSFRPMDFARKAQFLTLDVISAIAFGEPFGYVTQDEDLYDYIKTTEETVPMIILVSESGRSEVSVADEFKYCKECSRRKVRG